MLREIGNKIKGAGEHVVRHPIIYGGLTLLGVSYIYGDSISRGIHDTAGDAGTVARSITTIPGNVVGGAVHGTIIGIEEGFRWVKLPSVRDGGGGSGEPWIPTPKVPSSDDPVVETRGKTFTRVETIELFGITDSDGFPVDQSLLNNCPDEPEGTCYTLSGPVDVVIPDGTDRHTIDGDTIHGGTTYQDNGSVGDFIGFDYVSLRPGRIR